MGIQGQGPGSKQAEKLAALQAQEEQKRYQDKMGKILDEIWDVFKKEDLNVYDISTVMQTLDKKLQALQMGQNVNNLEKNANKPEKIK